MVAKGEFQQCLTFQLRVPIQGVYDGCAESNMALNVFNK